MRTLAIGLLSLCLPLSAHAEDGYCMHTDETITSAETSIFVERNGELIIEIRGKLFPKRGGGECGFSYQEFNLTHHLRELIAEALRK
jgi:hypothetical protein